MSSYPPSYATMSATASSLFFSLPLEIREKIYSFAFPAHIHVFGAATLEGNVRNRYEKGRIYHHECQISHLPGFPNEPKTDPRIADLLAMEATGVDYLPHMPYRKRVYGTGNRLFNILHGNVYSPWNIHYKCYNHLQDNALNNVAFHEMAVEDWVWNLDIARRGDVSTSHSILLVCRKMHHEVLHALFSSTEFIITVTRCLDSLMLGRDLEPRNSYDWTLSSSRLPWGSLKHLGLDLVDSCGNDFLRAAEQCAKAGLPDLLKMVRSTEIHVKDAQQRVWCRQFVLIRQILALPQLLTLRVCIDPERYNEIQAWYGRKEEARLLKIFESGNGVKVTLVLPYIHGITQDKQDLLDREKYNRLGHFTVVRTQRFNWIVQDTEQEA